MFPKEQLDVPAFTTFFIALPFAIEAYIYLLQSHIYISYIIIYTFAIESYTNLLQSHIYICCRVRYTFAIQSYIHSLQNHIYVCYRVIYMYMYEFVTRGNLIHCQKVVICSTTPHRTGVLTQTFTATLPSTVTRHTNCYTSFSSATVNM